MRYADCQGSFKCTNESCPFRVEFGVVNRTQINKDEDGTTTCGICGRKTEYVPCPGRRYVRYRRPVSSVGRDVAQTDVKDSVLLKAELKAIEQGLSKPAGRGPAFHEKRARDHRRELQKAVQLGKEVGSLAAGLEVDPQSGYFPPEDKSKRGRKRTKNCNQQKKPTARSEYSDPILTEKFSTTLSQPPTLSQPLLQARGSELQLESENGQLLSQGQSSQPLSQEQNSQLLSQGQSSQLLLQAKTVNCYRKLQVVNPCRKHIPVKCYHKCKVANRCRKYRLANLCYRRSINYCACLNQRASVSVNCQGNRSYTPPQQLPRRANQPQL